MKTFTSIMVKQFAEASKQAFGAVTDYVPEILIFFFWSGLLFVTFRSNTLETNEKFSICISTTALAVSLCTARYTLKTQPNVRLAEGRFPESVHIGSEVPLVFFNSGAILTYLKVVQIRTDRADLEVVLSSFPAEKIGDRCYWHKPIEIRKLDGGDIQSPARVRVTVDFLFWRSRSLKRRTGTIILELVPRG